MTSSGILIPGYIYPTSGGTTAQFEAFYDLVELYPEVPVYFVINPGDGPGLSADSNYQTLITRLRGLNVTVLGYVFTEYATRPIAEVKAEIDAYETYYNGINGIFLDEMDNHNVQSSIDYYVELTSYCHSNGKYTVIGNPGDSTVQSYFSNPTADTIVIYENSVLPTQADLSGTYGAVTYPKNTRAALVHSQSSFDPALMELLAENVGMLYITEDVMINPWDTFSTYMLEMFEYLSTERETFMGKPVSYGALTAATTTIFTSPPKTNSGNRILWRLDALSINNDSGASTTINVYIVPSGGSVADTNKIINNYIIPDNTSVSLEIGDRHFLLPDETVQITASAQHASLVYRASFKQENVFLE